MSEARCFSGQARCWGPLEGLPLECPLSSSSSVACPALGTRVGNRDGSQMTRRPLHCPKENAIWITFFFWFTFSISFSNSHYSLPGPGASTCYRQREGAESFLSWRMSQVGKRPQACPETQSQKSRHLSTSVGRTQGFRLDGLPKSPLSLCTKYNQFSHMTEPTQPRHGPGGERGSDSMPACACLRACIPTRVCGSSATRLPDQLTLYQLGSDPAAKKIQALDGTLPKTLSICDGLTHRWLPFLSHLLVIEGSLAGSP